MKKLKKILLRILLTVLVLTAIFFSLGLIFPSISYESKVIANKPISTSFGVFTNAFKLSDWVTGLKGVAWISGNQNQVGSKWMFIITQNGQDYKMVQTLKEFKKDELFAFNTDNEFFVMDGDVKFSGSGSTTEITATTRATGKNFFWKCALVVGQFYASSLDQKMYDQLKTVIEKEN